MKSFDIIIIGAGIAGLTAAIYARRAGKSVLVLEASTYGGQIINTLDVQNWPGVESISGADLMQKIYHQANKLGMDIEYEEVLSIAPGAGIISGNGEESAARPVWLVKTDESEYSCGAIIIATGSNEREMGVPGESSYIGRGVSFCATCDGAFYKDKNVAIVGGGNTAFYDALYLADLCKKIYLVHRRGQFRADTILVDKLRARKNVEFITPFVPTKVEGDKKVTHLKVAPSEGGAESTLSVDGIFVAIGRSPRTATFSDIVALDANGYIEAGEDCITSAPGIFAAGDVRTKSIRQLVTAASDGATAATAACRYLG